MKGRVPKRQEEHVWRHWGERFRGPPDDCKMPANKMTDYYEDHINCDINGGSRPRAQASQDPGGGHDSWRDLHGNICGGPSISAGRLESHHWRVSQWLVGLWTACFCASPADDRRAGMSLRHCPTHIVLWAWLHCDKTIRSPLCQISRPRYVSTFTDVVITRVYGREGRNMEHTNLDILRFSLSPRTIFLHHHEPAWMRGIVVLQTNPVFRVPSSSLGPG